MPLRISVLGAGFIGRNLLNHYVNSENTVRVLDRNGCPDDLRGKVDWVQGDFEKSSDVLCAIKGSDIVFHLISSTVPGDKIDENEEIFSNVVQTINLLKLCILEKVQRIIFISSSSVYGVQKMGAIPETATTDPISSHGIHKLTIEKYLQLYRYEYGLDCKIMRLSNPYGGLQNIFGRQGFIAIAIGKVLTGEPIVIRGDGNVVRDFIYIDDVIKACHLLATTHSEQMVFNIGSGVGVCLNDVVLEIQEITGGGIPVRYVESRKVDIPASILSIATARTVLGYAPTVSLNEGLQRTLSFYKKNFG